MWYASTTNYLHLPWPAGVTLAVVAVVGVAVIHVRSR